MKQHHMRAGGVCSAFFTGLLQVFVAVVLAGGATGAQAMIYRVTHPGESSANCIPVTPGELKCQSLRGAILAANASAANDEIIFDFQGQTITLTQGELIIANNGSLTIDGYYNTISGNYGSRVLRVAGGANVTLQQVTITHGYVEDSSGAGIYNQGTLTISTSTISDNKMFGVGDGGGIYNNGYLTIKRSTLSGNISTRNGGGIFNTSGRTLVVENSTLSGNEAAQYGGGIRSAGGTLDLLFVTLSGNSSHESGGALDSSGSTSLYKSVIANSTNGYDCYRVNGSISAASVVIERGIDCVSNITGNLYDIDPNLGPLASNGGPTKTHLPLPGSVLIDKAQSAPVSFDQRGEPRLMGAAMDIGAVEVVQPLFANGFE